MKGENNDTINPAPVGLEITCTKLADGSWMACASDGKTSAVVHQFGGLSALAPKALLAWQQERLVRKRNVEAVLGPSRS